MSNFAASSILELGECQAVLAGCGAISQVSDDVRIGFFPVAPSASNLIFYDGR